MTMRIIAVRTVYGEIIGRANAEQTDLAIEELGMVELTKPMLLMVMPMPTPQGMQMMNTMVPVSQLMNVQSLPIPAHHIVTFGDAHESAAKAYLEMTSGIALPPNTPGGKGLQLVKG